MGDITPDVCADDDDDDVADEVDDVEVGLYFCVVFVVVIAVVGFPVDDDECNG